jgi:hypothetical protein
MLLCDSLQQSYHVFASNSFHFIPKAVLLFYYVVILSTSEVITPSSRVLF